MQPPDDSEIDKLIAEHRNWGRWGTDDELGTFNLISPEAVRRGAAEVSAGLRVSCGRTLSPAATIHTERPMMHMMTVSGEGAPRVGRGWSSDWIGLEFHGYGVSHLDALSHQFWNGTMYNGVPAKRVTTGKGAQFGAVDVARDGIVTRGVLLDLPRTFGVPWIEPGDPITYDMLDEAEQRCGVRIASGDALLIRTGRDVRAEAIGGLDGDFAGLAAECVRFLAERDVALLGSDAVQDVVSKADVRGNPYPIHVVALVGLGLWLLDSAYLEDLATECGRLGRAAFQFAIGPLRIQYGTGSPVNPIAVL